MKKLIVCAGILILVFSLTGCDLLGSLFAPQDEIYFWSLFEEDGVHQGIDVERRLSTPFRIIMTRGESEASGGYDSKTACDAVISTTMFTVMADDIPLTGGEKVSAEHDDGWHIHQVFELEGADSGVTYTITGDVSLESGKPYEDLPWSFNLIVR